MSNLRKTAAAMVVVGGIAVGGAAIGSAATSSGAATTTTIVSPASMPAHGTAGHEDAEKPVTGDAAAKAQAAAVKIVGSGTAGAVTTDYPGTGYEVTVTKADGSTVEVRLDSSFNAVQMPARGPAHGSAAHEDAEKAVTGDAATKAQAAAVTAAGGGTAGAVTTDFGGTGYEVTVTKSDGSTIEIHLDSSLNAFRH